MKMTYKHDCEECVQLGVISEHKNEVAVDLYYCVQAHNLPTIVARFSNEPSDYTSSNRPITSSLRVGVAMAERAGFELNDHEEVS